ncbi:hypothetical protein PMAYCL1PPCAC_01178, partial [Pristionchus mayeri]
VFTTNHSKRVTLVNAVRSTAAGRRSLMAQLSATKTFLCDSHFSPSGFNSFTSGSVLKPNAVPFFLDSKFEEFADATFEEPIADMHYPSTSTSCQNVHPIHSSLAEIRAQAQANYQQLLLEEEALRKRKKALRDLSLSQARLQAGVDRLMRVRN